MRNFVKRVLVNVVVIVVVRWVVATFFTAAVKKAETVKN